MKIVCITPVWNEINFIEYKVNWCKNNGIDLYVINNESTDGTREYLVKNKIPFHDLDTKGAFDLRKIHKEILKTAKRLKPDWLMWGGMDFPQTTTTLRNLIEKANGNIIYLPAFVMMNTGEERGNPFHTYYYGAKYMDHPLIVKWDRRVTLHGDAFIHPSPKPVNGDGIIFCYGMTKTKQQREGTLKRRKKAWEGGLQKNFGKHYIKAQQRDWTWNKESLTDMRILFPELIKKLQEQI